MNITLNNYHKIPIQILLTSPNLNKEILEQLQNDMLFYPTEHIDLKCSIEENERRFETGEQEYESHISTVLFPEHYVTLHGTPKMTRSKKDGSCTFCGEEYCEGTPILRYRPLLWDHTANESYIMTSLIVLKHSCNHFLPETITDLEEMGYHLAHCYEEQGYEVFPNGSKNSGNDILYYEMSSQIGAFHMKKLKKHKKTC